MNSYLSTYRDDSMAHFETANHWVRVSPSSTVGWDLTLDGEKVATLRTRAFAERIALDLVKDEEAKETVTGKIPVTLHKGLTCSILTAKTGTLVVKEPRFNIDTIWNVHDGAELVSWAWTRQEAEDKARVLLQERKS